MSSTTKKSIWVGTALVGLMAVSAGAQTIVLSPGTHRVMMMQGAEGQQVVTAKDDLFAGTEVFAKNASDVTEITMDPDTLNMVNGKDKGRAHNMILNVVRTYEYDKPGMYNMADVDAFRAKLNTGDWHCSVHTRSLKTGESSDICQKHRTDGLRETAIITVEPKELTFIHTITKGYGPDSSEMGGMSFGGFQHLDALASLNPERMAEMSAAIARAQSADMARMQADMDRMQEVQLPKMKLDLDQKMKDAQKSLADAQKEMEKSQKDIQKEKAKARIERDYPDDGDKPLQ